MSRTIHRRALLVGCLALTATVACGESESDRYYGRLNRQIDAVEKGAAYLKCAEEFRAKRGQMADPKDACPR